MVNQLQEAFAPLGIPPIDLPQVRSSSLPSFHLFPIFLFSQQHSRSPPFIPRSADCLSRSARDRADGQKFGSAHAQQSTWCQSQTRCTRCLALPVAAQNPRAPERQARHRSGGRVHIPPSRPHPHSKSARSLPHTPRLRPPSLTDTQTHGRLPWWGARAPGRARCWRAWSVTTFSRAAPAS